MIRPSIAALVAMGTALAAAAQEAPRITAETQRIWDIADADQGVGVDAGHFYAVDNRVVSKIDKQTGQEVARFEGDRDGPIIHFDSAAIVDGLLYASHSNYPEWPMTSSVEIFDAETLEHVGTHSFGINYGSLTWIDRHDGFWWGTFANYNRVFGRSPLAYGNKYNTMMVQFDDEFRFVQGWTFPEHLVDSFDNMSNSGGSWGPDGKLYITGHDEPELYAMELPQMGSTLVHVGTVEIENTGQGFAWDRTADVPTVYAMIRGPSDPENKVTVSTIPLDQAPWNAVDSQ
ncbi:MAG: cycloisomerase [Pseudomonadota bacterium]